MTSTLATSRPTTWTLSGFGVTAEDFSTEAPLEERTADNLAYLRAIRLAVSV